MNEEQLNNGGQTTETNEQEIIASARESHRQEIAQVFNPYKMKVIRKELFPNLRDPAVTFRDGNITFNTACIKSRAGPAPPGRGPRWWR